MDKVITKVWVLGATRSTDHCIIGIFTSLEEVNSHIKDNPYLYYDEPYDIELNKSYL
jgi:hypothetical protein